MKKRVLFVVAISILFSNCASFSISKESFVNQLKENQQLKRDHNVISVGTGYTSNSLEKIKCIDKNGKEVWLYGGKNVNFKIIDISGTNRSIYFDTVFFQSDTIFGLKSRIVGGKRAIAVKDISKITINAEEAITKEVK